MIKLETNLARQAIKLEEFREFLLFEMKLTGKQLAELTPCPSCWSNFKTPGSIKRINEELEGLLGEGKIKKYSSFEETIGFQSKKKAHEYIDGLDEFETIYIAVKKLTNNALTGKGE